MVYQPKNNKKAEQEPDGAPEATRVFDRRAPRWMALLAALQLFLMLVAWRLGETQVAIGIALLIGLLNFHWFDLGWMGARFGPLSKFVHVALIWMKIPVKVGELAPHAAAARLLFPLSLLIWVGLIPAVVPCSATLAATLQTFAEVLAATLFCLCVFEALSDRNPLAEWIRQRNKQTPRP